MELSTAIVQRRARYPKEFTGEHLPNHKVERMLELANWAPTHKRTEPWRFLVYEGAGMHRFLDALTDHYIRSTPSERFDARFAQKMQMRKEHVSHVIVLAFERHPEVPEFEEMAALAMAVQNMWLFCEQQGIGAYWSSPDVACSPSLNSMADMPPHYEYRGLFYLGTLPEPIDVREGQRGNWREKVTWHKN